MNLWFASPAPQNKLQTYKMSTLESKNACGKTKAKLLFTFYGLYDSDLKINLKSHLTN